jgi:hypothetical protein
MESQRAILSEVDQSMMSLQSSSVYPLWSVTSSLELERKELQTIHASGSWKKQMEIFFGGRYLGTTLVTQINFQVQNGKHIVKDSQAYRNETPRTRGNKRQSK